MSDAREAILARVRSANSHATSLVTATHAWESLPRAYVQSRQSARSKVLALLEERLIDYNAHVIHVEHEQVAATVAEVCRAQNATRILVPNDFPAEYLPTEIEAVFDNLLSPVQLDQIGITLTEATLAIAETGTLALQSVPEQGRRALSLVPDVHLCLVRETDVVSTVSEAFTRLAATSTLPLTLVSGPSATADIEMTRIKGVHGPRTLYVLLLREIPE